jgi:glyoxylase-like metal-dependent hydrolase (beta-lactamase superfamily II)
VPFDVRNTLSDLMGGCRVATIAGEWEVELVELLRDERTVAGLAATPFAINVLLLRRDGLTALVDTGSGVMGPVMSNQLGVALTTDLAAALHARAVSVQDVDMIVLTHLDGDHVGGALAGEWPWHVRPAFPAARVLVSRVEVEAARAIRDPSVFEGGPAAVAGLEPVLEMVEDGAEVAPGIRLRRAAGHTPGHSIVEVAGDPPLVYSADVFHAIQQLAEPRATRADRDQEVGLATRCRVLSELAESEALVHAAHVPGPRPARVARLDGGYRWVPVD